MARTVRQVALISLFGLSLCGRTVAEAPTPLLQQLSKETEALYGQTRAGLVRVYLPPPKWALNLMGQDFTMKRWDLTLDESMSQKLRDDVEKSAGQKYIGATIKPSTQPSTQPAAARSFRLVPRGDGTFDLVTENGEDRAVMDVSPRSIGVVVDSAGHVLLPYYIEREAVGDQPLTVACGDGTVCGAQFVGSDRQTSLTILKLEHAPKSEPMPLTGRRPADGALAMFLNISGETGRLVVWTGSQQDSGIVISVEGGVAGFLRQGQFLDAARCRPVVDQLIASGSISRPVLGVFLREVLPADPVRRETPALGTRPAVMVMTVLPGSAAERAGLRAGDLILSLAGNEVGDPPSFAAAMTSLRGPTAVQILRDSQPVELSVDLQPRK